MIDDDKAKGFQPFLIIGNGGTINTGAVDDFVELSRIAKENNMWLHGGTNFIFFKNLTTMYNSSNFS